MTENSTNLWEEKNSTDHKMNSIKNEENDRCVTIGEIVNDSIKKGWSITTKLMLIKALSPPPVIYLIENKITGGKYVGQTIRKVKHRWNQHCRETRKETPLYRAIRKYGTENFEFTILEVSPTYRQLDELEKKHIKEQRSFVNSGFGGYNLTEGGNGMRFINDLTRKKIGESGKGRPSPRKGIPLSNQHKKLLSDLLSGENNPNYGKHHSVEVKKKISESQLGKVLSEEHKSKIRKSTLTAFENLPKESWKRMCDAGDKNLDRKIYSFKNRFTAEVFTGMRHELYIKYNLNKNLLRRMIKGELSHTNGWELVTSS